MWRLNTYLQLCLYICHKTRKVSYLIYLINSENKLSISVYISITFSNYENLLNTYYPRPIKRKLSFNTHYRTHPLFNITTRTTLIEDTAQPETNTTDTNINGHIKYSHLNSSIFPQRNISC